MNIEESEGLIESSMRVESATNDIIRTRLLSSLTSNFHERDPLAYGLGFVQLTMYTQHDAKAVVVRDDVVGVLREVPSHFDIGGQTLLSISNLVLRVDDELVNRAMDIPMGALVITNTPRGFGGNRTQLRLKIPQIASHVLVGEVGAAINHSVVGSIEVSYPLGKIGLKCCGSRGVNDILEP